MTNTRPRNRSPNSKKTPQQLHQRNGMRRASRSRDPPKKKNGKNNVSSTTESRQKRKKLKKSKKSRKNGKQRVARKSVKHSTANSPNIAWENVMILSNEDINSIYNQMDRHLSFKKEGFGPLKDQIIDSFVNENLYELQPCYVSFEGEDEEFEEEFVDNLKFIVWQIRNHRMNELFRFRNARTKSVSVFKSSKFRSHFRIKNKQLTFGKEEVQKWIEIAKSNTIPPYVLLKVWLLNNKLFATNKVINRFVKYGIKEQKPTQKKGKKKEKRKGGKSNGKKVVIKTSEIKPSDLRRNKSFRKFCTKISTLDCTSFAYESTIRRESQKFEDSVYRKVEYILQNAGVDRKLMTEKQQQQQQTVMKNGEDSDGIVLVTPDILLDERIKINRKWVHWIEMKNYFVSNKDRFAVREVKKATKKYVEHFGPGAIVCRGWEDGIEDKFACLLLDGSVTL